MSQSIPILNGSPVLSEAQQACVDLIEETLIEARRGKIDSVAIIACLKGGYASVMAGTQAGALNLGCDSLKRKILAAIEEDGNIKRASNIVRARVT